MFLYYCQIEAGMPIQTQGAAEGTGRLQYLIISQEAWRLGDGASSSRTRGRGPHGSFCRGQCKRTSIHGDAHDHLLRRHPLLYPVSHSILLEREDRLRTSMYGKESCQALLSLQPKFTEGPPWFHLYISDYGGSHWNQSVYSNAVNALQHQVTKSAFSNHERKLNNESEKKSGKWPRKHEIKVVTIYLSPLSQLPMASVYTMTGYVTDEGDGGCGHQTLACGASQWHQVQEAREEVRG